MDLLHKISRTGASLYVSKNISPRNVVFLNITAETPVKFQSDWKNINPIVNSTLKRESRRDDCPGRHWRRWSLSSTSSARQSRWRPFSLYVILARFVSGALPHCLLSSSSPAGQSVWLLHQYFWSRHTVSLPHWNVPEGHWKVEPAATERVGSEMGRKIKLSWWFFFSCYDFLFLSRHLVILVKADMIPLSSTNFVLQQNLNTEVE